MKPINSTLRVLFAFVAGMSVPIVAQTFFRAELNLAKLAFAKADITYPALDSKQKLENALQTPWYHPYKNILKISQTESAWEEHPIVVARPGYAIGGIGGGVPYECLPILPQWQQAEKGTDGKLRVSGKWVPIVSGATWLGGFSLYNSKRALYASATHQLWQQAVTIDGMWGHRDSTYDGSPTMPQGADANQYRMYPHLFNKWRITYYQGELPQTDGSKKVVYFATKVVCASYYTGEFKRNR